jgi:hypothetical protein
MRTVAALTDHELRLIAERLGIRPEAMGDFFRRAQHARAATVAEFVALVVQHASGLRDPKV